MIFFAAFVAGASFVRSAIAAQAYLIADAQTGYVLEEQEPRKKLQVGSLTKIATACVVLDWSEKKSGVPFATHKNGSSACSSRIG